MTDQEIYYGFLSGDNEILTKFFYGKFDRVLDKIIDKVFSKDSDFESAKARAFNDLYVYLTENDCKRLRGYESDGNGNFIVWLAMMAVKYYKNERNKADKHEKRIDDNFNKKILTANHFPNDSFMNEAMLELHEKVFRTKKVAVKADDYWIDNSFENKDFLEFCEKIINTMKNQKHAEIMRSLLIRNDFNASALTIELNLAEGSIYEIERQAKKQFLKIYSKLKEK